MIVRLWIMVFLHYFVFVMGRMYVDQQAGKEIRGAAQGLHAFVTLGIGMFVGSWLSGVVGEHYAIHGTGEIVTHDWQMIWAIPAVISVVLSVLFVVLFRDRETHSEELAHPVEHL